MPFQIVHNNIVNMKTDAIVNAANSMLAEGGGVCGAVFAAAGSKKNAAGLPEAFALSGRARGFDERVRPACQIRDPRSRAGVAGRKAGGAKASGRGVPKRP